ncbi:MAG TPA: alkaline phosphatase family protein [Acidobacteriota bacterium]|nr:alkaline phosphatase family protein [Acidobacteriota bacterium]HJO29458.1 alkaline phosphatase family protein [Acidobacteriota bacterium]
MTSLLRGCLAFLFTIPLATCGFLDVGAGDANAEENEKPALLVLIAVDQMRADYLDRFRPQFIGGLRTLLEDSAVFINARQDHAITSTAPGHAAMLSGLYPRDSGMVDNTWFDNTLGRRERAAIDPEQKLVGVRPTNNSPGVSPQQFLGTSLVGWLKDLDPLSQAVSISRKDRSAVLMAPEAEHVYWWHAASGRFISSTYYRDELPDWVNVFNDEDWLSGYLGGSWEQLETEPTYTLSRPDAYEGERGPRGFGTVFPHPFPTSRQALGRIVELTPFMDKATLDLGRSAITALNLGQDGVTDVLALGLSSTDSVGHYFGPYSRELQDQILRLDRMLGDFLDFVDRTAGLHRTLVILTADHGVAPLPEYSRELGDDAARLRLGEIYRGISEYLGAEFGGENWFTSSSHGWIRVDRAKATKLGVDANQIVHKAREYIETLDTVVAVFSHDDLLEDRKPQSQIEELLRRSFYAERLGDLYLLHSPLSFWQTGLATNHQSPYDYDRRVPLVLRGPGIRPGVYAEPVAIVDIAPTLAHMLELTAPNALEGIILEHIIVR